MNLRVRVVHCSWLGDYHWYADIDDADDPQPDDPFWYSDGCASQAEALELACAQLAELTERVERGARLERVLEAQLV
ncbi:hypothetical protein [Kribbella deserti]|uniref:Type II toxin-antitoxin system HicB family antitoxin n=1 Tax=Kribbella deserti TaxID=1926257 RepID=A0ABV6QQZ7_9ACTN